MKVNCNADKSKTREKIGLPWPHQMFVIFEYIVNIG